MQNVKKKLTYRLCMGIGADIAYAHSQSFPADFLIKKKHSTYLNKQKNSSGWGKKVIDRRGILTCSPLIPITMDKS